jgi:hypothetical protein
MCLVNKGLSDIDQPGWGGWSGRFTDKKVPDFWSRHADIKVDEIHNSPFYTFREVSDHWVDERTGEVYNGEYVPVWRWRKAMYNDHAARMDWCVKDFEDANHHPHAAVNGDSSDEILQLKCLPREVLQFNAEGSSDPDGDRLKYRWWIYEEAGNYPGRILLGSPSDISTDLHVPTGAGGKQIHLILEVTDQNPIVQLTDYRRIVIHVSEIILEQESIQDDHTGGEDEKAL